jgi:hypothetical protein
MKQQLQPILILLTRYRSLLMTVAILGICGYTAYQISLVVAVAPDPAAIEQEASKTSTTGLKFDNVTIKAITQQKPVNVKPDLGGLGTSNPFYGN